ncbi:MAG: hypothetical protein HYU75_02205 [Betaproteobacteria bacterium]|nr:hypothetical protein [Betaproteobacteria bacterium]
MKGTERQLLERRQRLARRVPPLEEILRGTVLTRELRCGKPTCHCASGPGHLATYLTVSFAAGRTEQISLPVPLVAQAQEWIANYQAWWNAVEAVSAINRELLRRRRGTSAQAVPPPRGRRARTPRS